MDAARLVKLPDGVSDREAAALMLKGLTAWFLLRRCHRVRRKSSCCCTPRRAASG